MKVSLNWLKEYVDISGLTPEAIAEALTNSGLEVESIDALGGEFSGVIVGHVEAVNPHPNADRLRLVTVDLGKEKNQVVCGAPNVAQGMWIAYAQIGAVVVNKKEGGTFTLKPATIRGVESTGMICSLAELGLENAYLKDAAVDGIWSLASYVNKADIGKDLKEALGLEKDIVLDVTPNANRGDLMSMIGVAREVAALFGRKFTLPKVSVDAKPKAGAYSVKLDDPAVCTYYAGAMLENVTIADSPSWMKARLASAGVRVINNVVDITNYVMLEYGQPLHAFDIGKLGASGVVGVRRAKPKETMDTLDEVTCTLDTENVVVTFNDKPVALGGVMGGLDSAIGDATNAVFLEAAYFPPASNRRNARAAGIRTESSARFERGVDQGRVRDAFERAIGLYQELAGAKIVSVAEDDHRKTAEIAITLSIPQMTKMLGIAIAKTEAEKILTILDFKVKPGKDADSLDVTVPSFRQSDVSRPIDLIEEVIRIYGYDKIPYTLPTESAVPDRTIRQRLLAEIRRTLTGSGFSEVATLSLIGEALLTQMGMSQDQNTTVRVTNSHSIDHVMLRQSLIPTLLEVAKHNQDQGCDKVWIYELGRGYFKNKQVDEKNSGVEEKLLLSGLIMGTPQVGKWKKPADVDFYTIKGQLENLFASIGLKVPRWSADSEQSFMHPGRTAQLKLSKKTLGFCGQLHPELQNTLKLKQLVYLFELDLELLYQTISGKSDSIRAHTLSAYQPVTRDMAFSAPLEVTHQQIVSSISQLNEPLLQHVELFDEYKGEQVTQGHRSLAYRVVLQSNEKTLTEQEIDAVVGKIKRQLSEQLPVSFR